MVLDQYDLMILAGTLNPGERIHIKFSDMVNAAKGELSSLIFDDVRDEDVKKFAKKIADNWGVTLLQNPETLEYVMSVPEKEPFQKRGPSDPNRWRNCPSSIKDTKQ